MPREGTSLPRLSARGCRGLRGSPLPSARRPLASEAARPCGLKLPSLWPPPPVRLRLRSEAARSSRLRYRRWHAACAPPPTAAPPARPAASGTPLLPPPVSAPPRRRRRRLVFSFRLPGFFSRWWSLTRPTSPPRATSPSIPVSGVSASSNLAINCPGPPPSPPSSLLVSSTKRAGRVDSPAASRPPGVVVFLAAFAPEAPATAPRQRRHSAAARDPPHPLHDGVDPGSRYPHRRHFQRSGAPSAAMLKWRRT